MKIALISCTSSKKDYTCRASEMYSPSPRFSLAYTYAKQVADVVYIISAKYGLLPKDQVIEPYNETLIGKSVTERKAWSDHVVEALRMMHSLDTDSFVILAGNVYNAYLLPSIRNYAVCAV